MTNRYTSAQKVPLLDIHGELSKLHHAVSILLEPFMVDITIQWRNGTYLAVVVECRESCKQQIVDRLKHGAVTGKYDYRFSVSYPTGIADPHDWVFVTAYVDMHHDRRKKAA
jgi:hypothetical protein